MSETVETRSRTRPTEAAMVSPRTIALLVAGLGTAVYCALAFGMPSVTGERFGTLIYNYYFLALLEGRFDIPLRIITLEGHYDAAGHAYVYHGLAPLITRALAWPFIDLTAVSLAAPTILLAAVGGTAVYHFVFVQIIEKFTSPNAPLRLSAGLLLGIMIWFSSPGLLLVANDGLYGEPIAMAYLFVACFLGLLAQVVLFEKRIGAVLLPLAFFAGLTVYARPHLAIGLYAAVCLLGLVLLWQKGWRGLPSAAGAVAILGAFGVALLVFNHLRFGNMLQMASGGSVEFGFSYWGFWTSESPAMRAGGGYPTFYPYRILPYLVLYLFDLPGGPAGDGIDRVFRYLSSSLGFVMVRSPRIGMVYFWLPWFVLAIAGLRSARAGSRHAWAPLIATGIGALMMASFVTVTLRYRIDFWPVLMALGMLALPRLLLELKEKQTLWNIVVAVLGVALVVSLIMMSVVVRVYAHNHSVYGLYSQWSFETCARMVASKEGLGADAVSRLCGL